jgi:flagellar motor switch protein FliG
VLKLFPDELRNELVLRIALLEKVQPAALKELNEVMSRSAGPDADFRRSTVGGVVPTAEILNMLSGGLDKEALTTIRNFNAELADAIQEKMFVFEDFNDIEDRSLQTLLLEVPQETLSLLSKAQVRNCAKNSSGIWPSVPLMVCAKIWRLGHLSKCKRLRICKKKLFELHVPWLMKVV